MNGVSNPKVVVVGAGFGGLSAVKALRRAKADITLIDRQNHHLFQPLLYQVATAALSPAEIASPIRSILRGQENLHVRMDEVTGVDHAAKAVLTASGARLPYDILIIGTGAQHSYFGHDDWAEAAPGLKSIDDATRLRARILTAFEEAEIEPCKARRDALLTFVVVGGGPTGVEMAGAIAELARKSITRDFQSITPHCSRVLLLEAGPTILSSFPESLSGSAIRALEKLGVETRLGAAVTEIRPDSVTAGNTVIPAHTVIWAAGVKASPAAAWLGVEGDRAGRVPVAGDFSVPGRDGVFVIGDTAAVTGADGRMLPGVAPAAKQAGVWVGTLVAARLAGKREPAAFRYRDYGNLATIGRTKAVADLGRVKLTGLLAWILWSLAHVYFLIGFKNRLAVASNWAWQYVTWTRGARLITGRA